MMIHSYKNYIGESATACGPVVTNQLRNFRGDRIVDSPI